MDRLRAEVTKLTQNAQAATMMSETEAALQGRLQLAQVHLQACSSAQESMLLLASMRIQAPQRCISHVEQCTQQGHPRSCGVYMPCISLGLSVMAREPAGVVPSCRSSLAGKLQPGSLQRQHAASRGACWRVCSGRQLL